MIPHWRKFDPVRCMNWPSDYPLLLRAADLTDGHSVGIRHFVGDLQSMPGALEIGAFYFQDENLIYLRGRRLISFSQPPKKTLYNYSTAFKHPFIDKVLILFRVAQHEFGRNSHPEQTTVLLF